MGAAEKSYRPLSVVERTIPSRQETGSHPLNFGKDTIFYSGPLDARETMVFGTASAPGKFYPLFCTRNGRAYFGEVRMNDGTTDRVWLHKKGKGRNESGWRTRSQDPQSHQYELKA